MAPRLSPEAEALVRELSRANLSQKKILSALKQQGIIICRKTLSDIVNWKGKRREAKANGENTPPKASKPKKRVPALIRKIDLATSKENPPTYSEMSKRYHVSYRTIHRVIHEDLGKKKWMKSEVHAMKESHRANRKTNTRKLYEDHLAGAKCEFVVSLDEAFFFLNDCNGTRKICYGKTKSDVEKFVVEKKEKFNDKFMVVGAISGRGTLPLFKVPQNVKVNARYYIDHVLRPLVEVYIPRLYGEDACKVFIHHDAATAHTAKITAAYAEEVKQKYGITIIRKEDIPVKSPDASPMDFFGFGYLKQRLFRRKASTLDGLWKVLQEEWNKVTPELALKVMESWKKRCRLINSKSGEHIENCKLIHKRKL